MMKNSVKPMLLLTIMALSVLAFPSCSNDDGPDPVKEEAVKEEPKEEPKEEEQPTEQTPSAEASNKIVENVIIKGGTKVEGAPPEPNKAISMDLSDAVESAVPDEGFIIPIRSEADVIGAYIQFKAIESGVSESYYDVDITANQEENEPSGKNKKERAYKPDKSKRLTSRITDSELDIDLGADIGPGEFCYIICVYDAAGNISEPQEVCVMVQAWGGNEALVGTWNLIRWEDFDGGTTETEIVGEEYCNEFGCETQEYGTITFNADGNYEYKERYIERDVDGTYGNAFDDYIERGKWSYPDGDNSDLVLVEYYYSEENEAGFQEETYTLGEAYTYFIPAESIELTATNLTIADRYDDDGDGNFEEIYTEFYEKQ